MAEMELFGGGRGSSAVARKPTVGCIKIVNLGIVGKTVIVPLFITLENFSM